MVFRVEIVECRVLAHDAFHLVLSFPRADGNQVSPIHETEVTHDGVRAVKQVPEVAEEAVLTASKKNSNTA